MNYEEKVFLVSSRMNAYAYMTGVGKRDKPLGCLARGFLANSTHADSSFKGGLSLLWGLSDPISYKLAKCMQEGWPCFHADHAYFKRGYEHGNFRVNFRHFHQTRLLDVPDDRSGLAKKRMEPWKKGGRDVVVIIPSESICNVIGLVTGKPITSNGWVDQTDKELRKHTDRPIVNKVKGPSILDYLRTAHAVVSLSSVAEVESALRGIPVFVSEYSPAQQVGERDLSKIETPIYPDRDQWLRTLSYSQFHVDEFNNGTAAAILKDLYL